MRTRRPSVFVGSSSEGLSIAEAIQSNLDLDCDVVVWHQGIFDVGGGALAALVDKAAGFDFAILVVTPDDVTESRGKLQSAPRDNVLLELGIFIGVIGRTRTFIAFNRGAEIKVPSDLAGVHYATFEIHESGNLTASLGAACTQFKTTIKRIGIRERQIVSCDITDEDQFQVICDLVDPSVHQFIVLMHQKDMSLPRRSPIETGIRYQYWKGGSAAGSGIFCVNSLCRSLATSDLLGQDLRNNVSLTKRGKEFASWLVQNRMKAEFFESDFGGWGVPPVSEVGAPKSIPRTRSQCVTLLFSGDVTESTILERVYSENSGFQPSAQQPLHSNIAVGVAVTGLVISTAQLGIQIWRLYAEARNAGKPIEVRIVAFDGATTQLPKGSMQDLNKALDAAIDGENQAS